MFLPLIKEIAYYCDLNLNWLRVFLEVAPVVEKCTAKAQTFGDFEAKGISVLHFERGKDFRAAECSSEDVAPYDV